MISRFICIVLVFHFISSSLLELCFDTNFSKNLTENSKKLNSENGSEDSEKDFLEKDKISINTNFEVFGMTFFISETNFFHIIKNFTNVFQEITSPPPQN